MSRSIALFLLLSFLSSTISIASEKKRTTKELMTRIYHSFTKIMPYISSELKFSDPTSKKEISKNLFILKESFKDVKHMKRLKTPGLSATGKLISLGFNESYESYLMKNYFFSRKRLLNISSLCINCHSQLSNTSGSLNHNISKMDENQFDNTFSYAEYLYLVRDYNKSIKYYKKAIDSRVKKNLELQKINKSSIRIEKQIRQALLRVLSIHTKINISLEQAKEFLLNFALKKKFSSFLMEDLNIWIKSIKNWSHKESEFKKIGATKFIDKYLNPIRLKTSLNDDDHKLLLLLSSGILYKELQSSKADNKRSMLLYWLAIIEENLSHELYYSLSDSYLKECIEKYPKTKYAKKCYKEYENNTILGHSGSSGLHIPNDVKNELKSLKKKVGL